MTMPQGRLHNPDSPKQEVLANGAVCGNALRQLAKLYWEDENLGDVRLTGVHYPLDYFGEDEEPVKSPITEMTGLYGAEDLPILAWIVGPGDGRAAIVVDMLERPRRAGVPDERGHPVTYSDCQLIQGAPNEVLPREIRAKMGIR